MNARNLLTIVVLGIVLRGSPALAESYFRVVCSPRTSSLTIDNNVTPDASPSNRTKQGFYSIQKTKKQIRCALGNEVYQIWISYHPSRERGECAAAEFWSLWVQKDHNQIVFTADGDVCFPNQPLLKSLRIVSTPTEKSVTACDTDWDGVQSNAAPKCHALRPF